MRSFNFFSAKGALPLLALACVLLAAPDAFAQSNNMPGPGGKGSWTVYAFGNAQSVADAFRAIHNFSTSAVFQGVVSFLALTGILVMALSSGFNSATAKRLIGYCVGVFLVMYVFFGVTNGGPLVAQVEVIDTVDNTWKAPVTVPAVVGIPAAVISTVGYKITSQIEASFPIPEELKMSNGAPFNLAAAMIQDAAKARITDSNLASSLAYYVQDCFVMGVSTGYLTPSTLVSSTDFLTDIKYPHPGVMVNTLLSPGSEGIDDVVSCQESWNLIDSYIKAKGPDATSMLSNASAWARTPALSVVNASMDAVAQYATNNGVTSGGSMVKQAAMLSAFNGAYKQAAAATGNSDFLTGLAMNQAYEAQTTGWVVGAEVFNRVMGYIFAVIQVFVYAITPFVLAAALIPGLGFALLKNFLQITLWLAIWQPMLAIVNFIVLSMQQAELGGAFASGAGHGFTLSSMGIISEKTANLRAASSFVGTMVPALAWAMVKGSVDFSRVIGSAVGENFAQQASNTMSTGNYSLNQASMDSFTANKHSVAHSSAQGDGFSSAGQVMNRKLDGGGTAAPMFGNQAMSATATYTRGLNEGGNTGDVTTVQDTGSKVEGYGTNRNIGNQGSDGNGVATVKGSGWNSGLAMATPLSGQISRPFGGGDAKDSAAPSKGGGSDQQPGPGGDKAPSSDSEFGKEPGKTRGNVSLGANITPSIVGTRSNMDQATRNTQFMKSVGDSEVANTALQAGTNASRAKSAGETAGWQTAKVLSISGPASLMERALVASEAMRLTNPFAGNSGGEPIQRDVAEMMNPTALPQLIADRQKQVSGEQAGHNKELDTLRGAALDGKKDLDGRVDAQLPALKEKAERTGAATTPASSRFGQGVVTVGAESWEKVPDFVRNKVEGFVDSTKELGKEYAGKAMEVGKEAVDKAKDVGHSAKEAWDNRNGAPAANPPSAPADAKPVQQAAASQPVQVAAADAKPVQQAAASQPVQVAAADAKPDPKDQKREQEQTVVAAAPQNPMQPVPVPVPVPVQHAALDKPSVPQTQTAQAQEQNALPGAQSTQMASLDPLNQPKPGTTEDQVRNAQHRSEQLEQNRRNADSILTASTDLEKVKDLQDAIQNAKNYTGRA